MARKHSGKPWLHGASGWWCTTVDGKRRKLDKDYRVACRKLKALRSKQKREQASGHDWLDARFAVLADDYLADSLARKKPTTYESRRYVNADRKVQRFCGACSAIEKYSAHYPCSLILSKTCIYRMIDAGHTRLRIVREMSDYRHGQVDEHPSRYSCGRHEQA